MNDIWHLIPEDDERFHKLKSDCWCNPNEDNEDGDGIIFLVHNKGGKLEDKILENYE